jgi:hypothetical protein
MDGSSEDFKWPSQPNRDWWMVTGTDLGMDDELIRFSAALWLLGGVRKTPKPPYWLV